MSANAPVVPPATNNDAAPVPRAGDAPKAAMRKMAKPKMDFAKALSIMGFSTSRTLDPSGGHDARVELNAALSRKMADIEKRKRAANKKDQTKVEDKLRDEIRTLHEAYQFLSRKYMKLAEQRQNVELEEEEEADSKEKQRRLQRQKSKAKKQDMEIDKLLEENEDLFMDDEEYDDYYDEENEENSETRLLNYFVKLTLYAKKMNLVMLEFLNLVIEFFHHRRVLIFEKCHQKFNVTKKKIKFFLFNLWLSHSLQLSNQSLGARHLAASN